MCHIYYHADLQVVVYLRGNKKLNIPPEWKQVIDLAVRKVMSVH
jgi:hypothetical protein